MDGDRNTAAAAERYYSVAEAFAIKHPPVPSHVFAAERDRALDPATPTGLIVMDLSARIGTPMTCTTPLLMARYVRLNAGEALATDLVAGSELYYAMRGAGRSTAAGAGIDWQAGDVFVLPGGGGTRHQGGPEGGVLFQATDEPLLAFLGLRPAPAGESPVVPMHYPAARIAAEVERCYGLLAEGETGTAVLFSQSRMDRWRTANPSMTIAINTLEPGKVQPPHRHNSAALTLPTGGSDVFSIVEGKRVDWQPDAVMVTPPWDSHSHINEGTARMYSIVVQDGGLHYYARTMNFTLVE